MKIRIISGIENIVFCENNIFKWFFDNFKIEQEPIAVNNSYELSHYITIKNLKDFNKIINKANISIIDTEYVISDENRYIEKTMIIEELEMNKEINEFFENLEV